ncbi:MAG: response regulator [Bacteroidota bacterium]
MSVELKTFKHQYTMIIDDEDLDNFLNEKLIAFNHFSKHVYTHSNAKSALEFLNNLKEQGSIGIQAFPEVIFIDLNMPVVDGFQFIQSLNEIIDKKEFNPKLVVLTSSVSQKDREKIFEMSPDYIFATKPLSGEYLKAL